MQNEIFVASATQLDEILNPQLKEVQQTNQVIIFANTLIELNKIMERMYDEGWKAVGSHKVAELHRRNRYSGSQHMDTIIELEYSQSMAKFV